MKKAFVTAALFAAAAITPSFTGVLGAIDIPGRASGIACAAASPIFWHVYDEFLSRALARVIAQKGDPHSSQTETAVCAFVQVVLARAFDGSLTAAQESQTMSIPSRFVRRVIERRFAAAPKIPAPMHHS
jgi:hypothetical protein